MACTNTSQFHPEPTMPKLPRILPRSFTDVYDLHISTKSFKNIIRNTRAACDAEFMTLRQLLLTYTQATNQPDTAYPTLRKQVSAEWLQKVHTFVTTAIGPSDLDLRAVGLGLIGDTVTECALILTVGLERVHLPDNGIWPDGTILGLEERQRRFFCCELQAMKLCLFTFQYMVQIWTVNLSALAHAKAESRFPAITGDDEMVDYRMAGF